MKPASDRHLPAPEIASIIQMPQMPPDATKNRHLKNNTIIGIYICI